LKSDVPQMKRPLLEMQHSKFFSAIMLPITVSITSPVNPSRYIEEAAGERRHLTERSCLQGLSQKRADFQTDPIAEDKEKK